MSVNIVTGWRILPTVIGAICLAIGCVSFNTSSLWGIVVPTILIIVGVVCFFGYGHIHSYSEIMGEDVK